ncbi:ATPase component of general energizing module of ECF transporters [Staphylococcus aureus]|nr:ATPase component of general energizing module of ECF transporters [Staphylococcus aureus]
MRKIAIVSILAMNPDIIVVDEPTAGLDPQSKRQV